MLHYQVQRDCDIHVVKMNVLKSTYIKHLTVIFFEHGVGGGGANKQLQHYRVTPTEPEVSREQHIINLGGSRLCQRLFASDTEMDEFVTCHIRASQDFVASVQPDF